MRQKISGQVDMVKGFGTVSVVADRRGLLVVSSVASAAQSINWAANPRVLDPVKGLTGKEPLVLLLNGP